MVVKISSRVLEQVLRAAADAPAVEVCGLLLGTAEQVTVALPCRNVAEAPATAFEIDPAQLLAAHRAARSGGPAIVGCYHSHPGGSPRPSLQDADAAAPDGSFWLIVAQGEARCYRAVDGGRDHDRFDAIQYHVVKTTLLPQPHGEDSKAPMHYSPIEDEMTTLTVTAKGQVTLKRDLLRHLGIAPGDKVTVSKRPGGGVEIVAAREGGDISDVFGMFGPTGRPAPTIEEINEVIAAGWAGEL